jgi:triphosphoribosyl-dephospho-CoA synthetase
MDGIVFSGGDSREELFARLKSRGAEMESAMFDATGGANTHKGTIFALSLLTGAAGVCLAEGELSPGNVRRISREIAYPAVNAEFKRLRRLPADGGTPLSNGEKIFLEHGVGGVRKEAMEGFPSVEIGLDAYGRARAAGAKGNDAALAALLCIMGVCEDTNVIHRAGFDFWRGEYMEKVAETAERFDPLEPEYWPLFELDEFLVSKNASPGGAADLLGCTLFLYRSKMPDNTHEPQNPKKTMEVA